MVLTCVQTAVPTSGTVGGWGNLACPSGPTFTPPFGFFLCGAQFSKNRDLASSR